MGSAVSKAANGIGGLLGNVFAAPFKTLLGASCEDVCAGPWDVICFIEHLCVGNLVKLVMILGLSYLTLLFFYLLFKVGICQCIGRTICKMCWALCETYWCGLEYMTCFLWHKLKNIKRVRRRRRFLDIEKGYSSGSNYEFEDDYRQQRRKRKSVREGSKFHHHPTRLKSREISFRVKGGSQRLRRHSSRQLQLVKAKNHHRNLGKSKRRRLK
ncbi:uncharacterized protein LOC126674315 isoform X2 [Mercurialis annua]|nr:uncharacterized protein LOC126674315 isoform X2 [Mercurialis annua]